MVKLHEICALISDHYPEKCAEEWDNPGLQLGRDDAEIARVLVALELTHPVIAEAIQTQAQLILTHHPFIFKPLKSVSTRTPEGSMLLDLAEHHIALAAAHTNLDAAPGAIAQKLAQDLGMHNTTPFLPATPYDACKIVVFVPEPHAEQVAAAMHEAGAGCVGNYSDVSFRASGTGYFTCGSETHPAIGKPGSAETVDEQRIEMVVSSRYLGRVIRALRASHPYEEPAFDVFRLSSEVHGISDLYGFGTIGKLPAPVKLADLLNTIKTVWELPHLRYAGDPESSVSRVAILNGSGGRYISKCSGKADVLITGDCGHHDFDNARRMGIALVDAGHYGTEKFIPQIMADMLRQSAYGDQLDIRVAQSMQNPMTEI